jgi:hypothetical protein
MPEAEAGLADYLFIIHHHYATVPPASYGPLR